MGVGVGPSILAARISVHSVESRSHSLFSLACSLRLQCVVMGKSQQELKAASWEFRKNLSGKDAEGLESLT